MALAFAFVAYRAYICGIGLLGPAGRVAHQDAPEKEGKYSDEDDDENDIEHCGALSL